MKGYINRVLLQSDLLSMTIYDLANEQEHTQLYNRLLQPKAVTTTPVQSSNSPLGKKWVDSVILKVCCGN